MPLINVIRGERIEAAPLHVRPPSWRVPLWIAVAWATAKVIVALVALAVRWWTVTTPALVLMVLWLRYGRAGIVMPLGTVAVGAALWLTFNRGSFTRYVWRPILGRWRRLIYRRRWPATLTAAGLAVRFDGHTVLPVLRRVKAGPFGDLLTVRIVRGQIPDDYARVAERLAHAFGVLACRVFPGTRPELVMVALQRRDPLAAVVAPLPVAASPDFAHLPLGRREDGGVYELCLYGTQVLIVGATGAGKGSVIWSVIRALAGGVAAGTVRLWVFDPKGGMELGAGAALFERFAADDYDAMATTLADAVAIARDRAARLRGITRQHTATTADPLIVMVIDELATLTAYCPDRKVRDRIRDSLAVLLTQGRAVGVHVIAALQDPRKEVLPFRNLFPVRIGLRLAEASEVDLVLGTGMRDKGALCDRIPQHTPGVGYVVLDGDPTPTRVRFSYVPDKDIHDLAATYQPLRTITGTVIDGHAEPRRAA
jgi:hypothetical protein